MQNYKDFDEFFNELEKKPALEIKLFDSIYYLPSEIPAMTILEAYKVVKSGQSEISDAKQMEIAMTMLGEKNVEDWCNKGLTISQLTEIMKWVSLQTQGGDTNSGGKK